MKLIIFLFVLISIYTCCSKITDCQHILLVESSIDNKYYVGVTCMDTDNFFNELSVVIKKIYNQDIGMTLENKKCQFMTINNSSTKIIDNAKNISHSIIIHNFISDVHYLNEKNIAQQFRLNQIIQIDKSLYIMIKDHIKTFDNVPSFFQVFDYGLYSMHCSYVLSLM